VVNTRINDTVCQLLDQCYSSDEPCVRLHAFVDELMVDPSWSTREVCAVLTRSHRIVNRSLIGRGLPGQIMDVDPKSLLREFLRASPNATRQEAIEYANHKFPHSPLTIALFLADWLELSRASGDRGQWQEDGSSLFGGDGLE
jgi:hypothetical protein